MSPPLPADPATSFTMKKSPLLPACLATLVLLAPLGTEAAKADGPKARAIAKFDANKNGRLDPDEFAAIRAAFASDMRGELTKLDRDQDGKLSDDELASVRPGAAKKTENPATGGEKKGSKSKEAR